MSHEEAYHSHYCEENIYKLAFKYKNLYAEAEDYDSYVVFISNDERAVPLWEQKTAPAFGRETLWDYHVIFVIRSAEGTTVIDLDSNLGYRVPFEEYVKKTFKPDMPMSEKKHEQVFRVVPANTFLDHFASDRSHMINHDYGGRKSIDSNEGRHRSESTDQYRQRAKSIAYKQPPPSWPPVYGPKADRDMNLDYYISMEPELEENIYGKVMEMKDFIAFGKI